MNQSEQIVVICCYGSFITSGTCYDYEHDGGVCGDRVMMVLTMQTTTMTHVGLVVVLGIGLWFCFLCMQVQTFS